NEARPNAGRRVEKVSDAASVTGPIRCTRQRRVPKERCRLTNGRAEVERGCELVQKLAGGRIKKVGGTRIRRERVIAPGANQNATALHIERGTKLLKITCTRRAVCTGHKFQKLVSNWHGGEYRGRCPERGECQQTDYETASECLVH